MKTPPRLNSAQNERLSRRSFLTTAAAAGSAAALGMLGGGGRAVASARTPRRLPASPGVKGLIGSTVTDYLYGYDNRIQAASIFDGYVSSALGAQVIQKYYFAESQWLTTPLPDDVTELPHKYPNFKWIMCFRPSLKLTTADQTNLQQTCQLLVDKGINFDVTLWEEPNGQHRTQFKTAADYQNYYYFYAPYVPTSVDLIYLSCGSATQADQLAFFPSQGRVDKVYCDFYGNVYATALWEGIENPLANLEGLADDHGLPFGIGEWGYGTTPKDYLDQNSKPTAEEYVNYILSVFTARLSAGKTNGDLIYFDGQSPADTQNLITATTDWKVPLYQQVYNELSGTDG